MTYAAVKLHVQACQDELNKSFNITVSSNYHSILGEAGRYVVGIDIVASQIEMPLSSITSRLI